MKLIRNWFINVEYSMFDYNVVFTYWNDTIEI